VLNPRLNQIVPRLFWPVLALSLLSGLAGQALLALRPEAFSVHFFRNPVMLAAVHLTSLGWLASLFLAVGVQALSVILHRARANVMTSLVGQGLFFGGTVALVGFLAGQREAVWLVSALLGLAFGYGLLVWQALRLSRGTELRTGAWRGLRSAYAYLGALLALGAAMACGLLKPLLPQPPLATLALHVHLALAGFAGLAIVGLLPKLLRLFLGAKGYPLWPGRLAMGCIHAGLLLYGTGWLMGAEGLVQLGTGLLVLAATSFVIQVLLLARTATKPLLSSSFLTQGLALVWLLAAAVLDLSLILGPGSWRLAAAATYLALFGWIGGTLLGTAQRIVAVLAWFQRFHEDPPTHQVPTAWDLVDPRLAWAVPCLHSAAVLLGTFGLALGQTDCLRASGLCGMAALLATLGLAQQALHRGRKKNFPQGLNPYLKETPA
jgi:hypothetical protein